MVDWPLTGPGLVDLDSLVMLLGFDPDSDPRDVWVLRDDAVSRLELSLEEAHHRRDQCMRYGHSSVAAARILLRSMGRCSGCDFLIDLTGEHGSESFRIRRVDAARREPPEVLITDGFGAPSYVEAGIPANCWRPVLPADWPGVLCLSCHTRMVHDGYTSLIDFRFSQHAKCPRCGAAKSQAAKFGMPSTGDGYRDSPPWIDWRGCCDNGDHWKCTMCTHRW